MKRSITLAVVSLLLAFSIHAQVSNDDVQSRIRMVGAAKSVSLEFNKDSNTTKVMAVSENFSSSEVKRSGLTAMNFALGYYYATDVMTAQPETFLLTFWAMTSKPRFATRHDMTAVLADEMLVLGNARYSAKPRQEMEYLNFEISRANLSKIAAGSAVKFHLGDEEFTFTKSQMKLLADMLLISGISEK